MLFVSAIAALITSCFALLFAAAMGRQLALEDRSGTVVNIILAGAAMTLAAALWIMVGIVAGALVS